MVPDPLERQLLPSTSYIYARPEVLADPQKAEAIREFLASFVRAGRWSNTHRKEWEQHYLRNFQRLDAESAAAIQAAQAPLEFQTAAQAQPHHQKLIDILHSAGSLPRRLDARDSFVASYDGVIVANR